LSDPLKGAGPEEDTAHRRLLVLVGLVDVSALGEDRPKSSERQAHANPQGNVAHRYAHTTPNCDPNS
jgi:hypothetical protein